MRATKSAPVEKLGQGEQYRVLVLAGVLPEQARFLVLAVVLPQVTESDEAFDFVISKVQGDASQTLAPPLSVSPHPSGAGGDTRYLFRIEWRIHLKLSAFTQNKL